MTIHQLDHVTVLIVDDQPDRHEGLRALSGDEATFIVRTPEDVDDESLADVDLISVDEYLGPEWQAYLGDSGISRALFNMDGLSVAASFRSQGRNRDERFGVSLHTGDLATLSAGLPLNPREALTAAQHDLDWVFAWEDEGFARKLVVLARAVRSAASAAPTIQNDFGAAWLGINDEAWAPLARRHVEDCRPPAHGLSMNSRGASYVRWLAQRILPYPTFLIDKNHAANFLGIDRHSFATFAKSETVQDISARYVGPLNDFSGDRWWRAAFQQLLAELDVAQWMPPVERAAALSNVSGVELSPLGASEAVVTYDASGVVTGIGSEASSAVRIHTDGWPVYADDPWALLDDVSDDPSLAQLVSSADRQRLDANGDSR